MSALRTRAESAEVLIADGPIVPISTDDVAELKRAALANPRQRIRVCTHPDTADPLHEMVIVHTRDAYVRPHKHVGKSESMHVLEGEADAVFFDDDGDVTDVVPLAPYGGRGRFYFRVGAPLFHTLLIRSDCFVFHEVTNGPFRREDTVFASWAPEEDDEDARVRFADELDARVAALRR